MENHNCADHFLQWAAIAKSNGYVHDFHLFLCGTLVCLTSGEIIDAAVVGIETCVECKASFYLIDGKTATENFLGIALDYWD